MKKIYLFQFLVLSLFAFNCNAMDKEKGITSALQQIAFNLSVISEKLTISNKLDELRNIISISTMRVFALHPKCDSESESLLRLQKELEELIQKKESQLDELRKQFSSLSDSEPIIVDDLLLMPKEQ